MAKRKKVVQSREWRIEFLDNVAKKLDDGNWNYDSPEIMGGMAWNIKRAQKLFALPPEVWEEISRDFKALVSNSYKSEFIFLTGFVIGWIEARKAYDPTWVKKAKENPAPSKV